MFDTRASEFWCSALYSVKKEQLIIATDFIPFDLLPLPSSPIDGFYFHQSTSTPPASAHVQTDLDRLLLKLTHELIKIHRSDQVARIPPGVAIEGFLPVPTAEEPNCINRLWESSRRRNHPLDYSGFLSSCSAEQLPGTEASVVLVESESHASLYHDSSIISRCQWAENRNWGTGLVGVLRRSRTPTISIQPAVGQPAEHGTASPCVRLDSASPSTTRNDADANCMLPLALHSAIYLRHVGEWSKVGFCWMRTIESDRSARTECFGSKGHAFLEYIFVFHSVIIFFLTTSREITK